MNNEDLFLPQEVIDKVPVNLQFLTSKERPINPWLKERIGYGKYYQSKFINNEYPYKRVSKILKKIK